VSIFFRGLPLFTSRMVGVVFLLCLVTALVIAIVFTLLRRRKQGDAVLLVGLPNSGKTTFWYEAVTSEAVATHTSMKENVGVVPLANAPSAFRSKSLTLVDLPGHPRLSPLLSKYLPRARAIAFFVDSVDVMETLTPCTELLYQLLTSAPLVARQVPVMVACNKRDVDLSYKLVAIKNKLETELNVIRKSKQNEMGALGDTDVSRSQVVPLGIPGQPFAFDTHSPLPLHWCEISVRDRRTQPLTDWMWAVI